MKPLSKAAPAAHRSAPPRPLAYSCLAEALGTFCLVFAGAGAIMVNAITGGSLGQVGIGVTFGLVVTAMVFALGHLSGAHINPAVTLAFATVGTFRWRHVPFYVVAQLSGAVAASLLLLALLGNVALLGATVPLGSAVQSLVLETVLTFILMFVIMAVATDPRANGGLAALAIGAVVGLEATFAGPISGASMNPARSLGPALVSGAMAHQWVYWVGPITGAVLGALAYRLLRRAAPPSQADDRS